MLGPQVPKSGLMGFGNCAHEEDKHLRVLFLWHGRPHAATLADQVLSPAYILQNPAPAARQKWIFLILRALFFLAALVLPEHCLAV